MTQQDVLDWVVAHGCEITHEKKNFYRVTNSEGKAMGIPQPREGKTFLQPMTICRICRMLKIPVPDYAKEASKIYEEIQKTHEQQKNK